MCRFATRTGGSAFCPLSIPPFTRMFLTLLPSHRSVFVQPWPPATRRNAFSSSCFAPALPRPEIPCRMRTGGKCSQPPVPVIKNLFPSPFRSHVSFLARKMFPLSFPGCIRKKRFHRLIPAFPGRWRFVPLWMSTVPSWASLGTKAFSRRPGCGTISFSPP